MPNLLLVPTELQAFVVAGPTTVMASTADFSVLAVSGASATSASACLGSNCVSSPLAAASLPLQTGIHLHWGLPSALRLARSVDGVSTFPNVPNRWLITRSGPSVTTAQWVVESDYLYPVGTVPTQPDDRVTYPVMNGATPGFRYIGRQIPLSAWPPTGTPEYLGNITAVGYGDPTFASLYSNCTRVFGAVDAGATPSAGLQYSILGWYSNSDDSPLVQFITTACSQMTAQETLGAIQKQFGWQLLPQPSPAPTIGQFVCYAKLNFGTSTVTANPHAGSTTTSLAIGNTGSEALAAWLSYQTGKSSGGTASAQDPDKVEDLLESLRMIPNFSGAPIDSGAKFYEARHAEGFQAESAGTLWVVRPQGAQQSDEEEDGVVTLPAALAAQLNELNLHQAAYDASVRSVDGQRRQLFQAWCQYVTLSSTPSAMSVASLTASSLKTWISGTLLPALTQAAAAKGELTLGRSSSGHFGIMSPTSNDGSLAGTVQAQLAAVQAALTSYNATITNPANQFVVQPVGAPRFWRPTNPVVALIGGAATGSSAPASGPVPCLLATTTTTPGISTAPDATAINAVLPVPGTAATGVTQWTGQPWSPLLLDWQATLAPAISSYAANSITNNYNFTDSSPDLQYKFSGIGLAAGQSFSGRSLLSAGVSSLVLEQIGMYLIQQILMPYYTASKTAPDDQTLENLNENLSAIITFFTPPASTTASKQPPSASSAAPALSPLTPLLAYQQLLGTSAVSQSLSDLNDAMLMLSDQLQLPVYSTAAADAGFAASVAAAVGSSSSTSPLPGLSFNPIRSGLLQFSSMRIVDRFGQTNTLPASAFTTMFAATGLRPPTGSSQALLPPRYSQAARFNLRWLSASEGTMELNSHPATTPVCGWILPNILDEALMIYSTEGQPLGSISALGDNKWQPAPGGTGVASPAFIQDRHLRQMVEYLAVNAAGTGGTAFLSSFMQMVDTGLGSIDPTNHAQHNSLSLLLGRPVALVRLRVGIELKGAPAVAQDWQTLANTIAATGTAATATGFSTVQIPVRIGAATQYGDGVIGYWMEDADGSYSGAFQAIRATAAPGGSTTSAGDGPTFTPSPLLQEAGNLLLTPSASSTTLSLLMDPRAKVHASSGVLPVKAITIPEDQFADAMHSLAVSFLTAPILSSNEQPVLPLPETPGHMWQYLEPLASGQWKFFSMLSQSDTPGSEEGALEIRDGWLQLNKETQA